MKNYIIFDNGGRTEDRFTIINTETGDVFGASEDPCSPDGIGKWCGNIADHRTVLYGSGWRQRLPAKKIIQYEVENYVNNARLDPDWIGAEVDINTLSDAIHSYVNGLEVDDPRTHSRAKIASFGEFQRTTKAAKSK